jgi:hypothetical protein
VFTSGIIDANDILLNPTLNGLLNVQSALTSAIYNLTSPLNTINIVESAVGNITIDVVQATEAQRGGVEIATQAETDNGTLDTVALTPLKLANRRASETLTGIASIATQAEVNALTNDTEIVTPLKIGGLFASGAIDATDVLLNPTINGNTTVQTALDDAIYDIASANNSVTIVETAVGQIDLAVTQATEAQIGGMEIATQAETNNGILDTVALTPLKLETRKASETLTGIASIATQAEVNSLTSDSEIVTPLKLGGLFASGAIDASDIALSPSINGNLNVQTALNDAVYNVASSNSSITVTQTAVGQVNVVVTQASETQIGGAEIATQAETEAGTDDLRIVTPLKLRTAAVYKSDFNAKGDLLSATASDTPAVLPVGTNGQVLKADSFSSTGLSWGAAFSFYQLDSITFDGVSNAFTLRIGGVNYSPNPTSNLMVFLGGIAQIPGAGNAYTVAGSTITFDSPPPAGTTFYATTVR